jgi:hypothetical protein
VAAPGQRTRAGPFEFTLEAARPRILPGEENDVTLQWSLAEGQAGAADLQIVLDLPAEVSAPEARRAANVTLGGPQRAGEVVFPLMGQEPGGVWIDALLTLEDDMGRILGRAKAGFAVARHRVVIADVTVEPPVVAAGDAFVVRAHHLWTGAARVRGTLGGSLRRRSDGHTIELHREKVSALGDRVQEWTAKAPIDQVVADFDVELTFEGRETQSRAQFGKTGVLAVRRGQDAEVASLRASALRGGEGEAVEVRALVRNTGVRTLQGEARLELWARDAGSPDAGLIAGVPDASVVPLAIAPAGAAEAAWGFKIPAALEGRRLEGHVVATFGSLAVEARDVLLHVVPNHQLEFDGFAADRYAYAPGEVAAIECRVRDDGARPGGPFRVVLRLKDEGRTVAESAHDVRIEERATSVRGTLQVPEMVSQAGVLDLEVSIEEPRAVRKVPGFLRVRQAVASRVVIVKPPSAHGLGAFLFEAEVIARQVEIGEVEGAGGCRLVVVDSGAYFAVAPGEVPLVGRGPVIERAAAKALALEAGAPPAPRDDKAWRPIIKAMADEGKPRGATQPSALAALAGPVTQGAGFEDLSKNAAGALAKALSLTAAALGGRRLPASELASMWVEAAEEGGRQERQGEGEALRALRAFETEMTGGLGERGLTDAQVVSLAQAAVLRRAVETQVLARAVLGANADRTLGLSVAVRTSEDRLRGALRYYTRFLSKLREASAVMDAEGATRRQLASLRAAVVELKGADKILPGRYNSLEVRVRLPPGSPGGGMVSAAVALPSELWILGSATAERLRGQYMLPAVPLEPGAAGGWKLDLYVPDRAGGEPGAIEIRLGFQDDEAPAPSEVAP